MRALKTSAGFFGIALLFAVVSGCMPIKNQKETYATFIEFSPFASGGSSYWEFHEDGKQFEVVSWRPTYMIPGEKYVMIYDSLKPKRRYAILRSQPVFVHGEVTGKTICTVEKDVCITPKEASSVEYNYSADDALFHSSNGVPARQNDTLYLKKGDQFEVEYWIENPQRSIIHLDKPM